MAMAALRVAASVSANALTLAGKGCAPAAEEQNS
ncbi:hypothetical protein SAMN05445504_8462 [Burkholderia sp. CF099]|nr:hypothetical protein SAMN05445504_8462 [Burkholderia sp. CF099]